METLIETHHDEYVKVCKECKTEFAGRLNQTFCTSSCKSKYNNRFARIKRNATKDIDYILHKNRSVLLSHYHNDPEKSIPKDKLAAQDFEFKYHTHMDTNEKGEKCSFYYEFGLTRNRDGFKIFKVEGFD